MKTDLLNKGIRALAIGAWEEARESLERACSRGSRRRCRNTNKAMVCLLAMILLANSYPTSAQVNQSAPYRDLSHYSKIFGKEKYYRLYLPAGYEQGDERYPVIYFFHGWGGRHYMDPSAKLEYEMIHNLVDKYQVILVMWDGNYEEEQPRPYNMGYHENITSEIQMKDYYLELINHVDSTYRTMTDREHRGIIGFSMGGMMSWFLAGKYPDRVGAAVSMSGSPEFFIGYPGNHTLLPLRYAFKNLKDVRIRLHNAYTDELEYLNTEVHKGALWEGGLAYSYEKFEGGHMVDYPGETKVFEKAMKFVTDAFRDPLPRSDRWWHYDFYPEFEVWDYKVSSGKQEPGFIVLKRVSKNGFGIASQKWLPDGPPVAGLTTNVTTAPHYDPNGAYVVVHRAAKSGKMTTSNVVADGSGRLQLSFNEDTEVGIYKKGESPDLIIAGYALAGNQRYLRAGQETELTLNVFNRGGKATQPIEVKIVPQEEASYSLTSNTVIISKPGKQRVASVPFQVRTSKTPPAHAEPAWTKLKVMMKTGLQSFEDEVVLPIFFDVPVLENVGVDDGRAIRDSAYGKGNGDGIAKAGETIMLYADNHRLRLYTDDPYVLAEAESLADEVVPSRWPDGFTLSSVVKIGQDCPDGHVIEFLASYETKDFETIERKVTWGKVLLRIAR